MAKNPHIGSPFEEFLAEEGILSEVEEIALKRVLAWQIQKAMEEERLTKTEMARRMKTSRASLNRLLDPENGSVTLHTIERAAAVVGKRLRIELDDLVPSGE